MRVFFKRSFAQLLVIAIFGAAFFAFCGLPLCAIIGLVMGLFSNDRATELIYGSVGLLLMYGAAQVALWRWQENLLFLVRPRRLRAEPDFAPFGQVRLSAADGVSEIFGWFIEAPSPTACTILYAHGIGQNIAQRLACVRRLHELGVNVFIYDYRGFGASDGQPSESGSYEDAQTAWTYLTVTRGLPPDKIILYGHSLGAAITLQLATQVTAAGVILEAPFASLPSIVRRRLPTLLPIRYWCRLHFNNQARLPYLRGRVLFLHSRSDELIPFADGEQLYNQARGEKYFAELSGTHDQALALTPNLAPLRAFIARCV